MKSTTNNHPMVTRSKMIKNTTKPVTKDSTKRCAESSYPDKRRKKRGLIDNKNQTNKVNAVPKNVSDRKFLKSKASSPEECMGSPKVAVQKNQSLKVEPEGVEDFDKSCLNVPYSKPHYAADIFSYFLEREKLFPVKKYLPLQEDMTKEMRAKLVYWMVKIRHICSLKHETFHLAVKLFDRYLSMERVPKYYLQLIAAGAIRIAAKFEECEFDLPPAYFLVLMCTNYYFVNDLIVTEIKMLQTLDSNLGIPMSYKFLHHFVKCARLSMENRALAEYILETALMDYELIDVLDSKLAAGCLLLALKMNNQEWTLTNEFYTGYKEEDLKGIIYALNKNIYTMPFPNLSALRRKYF